MSDGLWLSISEIAKRKGVTRQSISERVARLVDAGALTTRPGAGKSKLINLAQYDTAIGRVGDVAKEQGAATKAANDAEDGVPALRPTDGRFRDEQTRDKAYAADLKFIELERLRGNLLQVAEFDLLAEDAAGRIGDVIDGLLARDSELTAVAIKEGENGMRAALKRISRAQRIAIVAAMKDMAAAARARASSSANSQPNLNPGGTSMMISRELMGRLPAAAQERLRVLYEQSSEAGALSHDTYQRLIDIRKRVAQLETFRSNTARDRDRSPQSNKSKFDDALKEFDAELESLAGDRARLSARQELSKGSQQQLGGLLRSIEGWLEALPPDMALTEHPGGDKSYKIEVSPNAIEKQRRRIRELLADIRRTDSAPYPAAVAKQAARKQIEQLAEHGRPAVYRTIELLEPIEWPAQVIDILTTLATPKARDGIALVAWLQRDALIALVEKEIDDNATDEENALTDAQRSEAFKIEFGDLLAAEREEEALIQAAHFNSDRRADADPRAVLGLASELPGPKRELVHRRLILSVETMPRKPPARPEGPGKSAAVIKVHRTSPSA